MHAPLPHPHRLLSALCAALLLAGGLGASPSMAQDGGQNMLWTLSKNGNTAGYLVGSVHFMKPEAYPLPAAYDDAFAAADVLAFETNLDSAEAQSQTLIRRLGMYAGSKTLKTELADSTYALLQARTDSLGLNLTRMRKLEPWVMSMVVPVTQMQRAGYSGQSGIDRHFFTKAKKADKERTAFETPAQQMSFFDQFPSDRQEAFLRYSLQEAARNVQRMDDMTAAWMAGDTEQLETFMQDQMQTNFPDLYQTLIVERNQNWMPQITALLDDERRPMIVVGAGHVVGEEGLVTLLREKGYTVTQQ
jgi:uncharacterized protein YbaP (TraB family)